MKRLALLLLLLPLAACNPLAPAPEVATPTAPPASAAAAPTTGPVTPQNFVLPEGGSCAGDIARYRAIQDNDLAMGHVAKTVYEKIKTEIAAAESECTAGHEAKSRALIVESRKKHGYPTDL